MLRQLDDTCMSMNGDDRYDRNSIMESSLASMFRTLLGPDRKFWRGADTLPSTATRTATKAVRTILRTGNREYTVHIASLTSAFSILNSPF